MLPESRIPAGVVDVTVWTNEPWFVQMTLSPTSTTLELGLKKLSPIAIATSADLAVGRSGMTSANTRIAVKPVMLRTVATP
jgi:hypothetical protein